jgi:hypothetical protein
MTETYDVLVERYEPTDPRLGRNVRHDSRSLSYLVEARDTNTLVSVKHETYIPTLQQGQLGSCTGNAGTKCLGTGVFWASAEVKNNLSPTDAAFDENFAVGVYSECTSMDPFSGQYPPTDTGSDGLTVAKVFVKRGLISGFKHATSLEAVLTALSVQPVIVGTKWLNDMFTPEADGRLKVSGSVAGGHEYMLDELDVENKRVWIHNSWGDEWGINGRAYITWDDLAKLLADNGDCTVFVPITEPAPTPTPPPAPPQPEPSNRDEILDLIGSIKDSLVKVEGLVEKSE